MLKMPSCIDLLLTLNAAQDVVCMLDPNYADSSGILENVYETTYIIPHKMEDKNIFLGVA